MFDGGVKAWDQLWVRALIEGCRNVLQFLSGDASTRSIKDRLVFTECCSLVFVTPLRIITLLRINGVAITVNKIDSRIKMFILFPPSERGFKTQRLVEAFLWAISKNIHSGVGSLAVWLK